MPYRLARSPWAVAVRGAAAAAFGLLTIAWPTMTVATFLALFAVYALVDGLLLLLVALRFRSRAGDVRGPRDPLFAVGAAGVAGGLAAALWPSVTMRALLLLMAAWAAATGAGQVVLALRARGRVPGAWLLGGAGVAGLALAAVLVAALAAGEVRVGWPVALYGFAAGGMLLAMGTRLVAAERARAGAGGAPSAGNPAPE